MFSYVNRFVSGQPHAGLGWACGDALRLCGWPALALTGAIGYQSPDKQGSIWC